MLHFLTITLFICIQSLTTLSQTANNLNELIKGKIPSEQFKLLDSLAIYNRDKNTTESIRLSQQALILSKNNNLTKETIKSYLTLSRTYRTIGSYDTALLYIDSSKTLANTKASTDQLPLIFDFEGMIYMRTGNYEEATKSFYKCIEIAEKQNDKTKTHDGFAHLGSVEFYRGDFKKSINYYKKALAYINTKENKSKYILTLDNIGLDFNNMKMFDSALYYQKRAVSMIEQLKDSTYLAESYINIGSTLLNLNKASEAEYYIKKAYVIDMALNKDYGIQLSNLYMGKLYKAKGQFKEALPYLLKSYSIAKSLEIPSQIRNSASMLTEIYDTLGLYNESVPYYKEVIEMSSVEFSEQNAKAIQELSTKYETEKKQEQIQQLKADSILKEAIIQKDKNIQLFIGIISFLLLVMSAFFIYRFIEKKKDNKLLQSKNESIEKQNTEINSQKEQLQHKNIEITDSINYAKRIQSSVLPSVSFVKNLLPNSFIYFKPKDIVSGDFYWAVQKGNFIYFALADCTGHGVPGAMMSMLGSSLLNQIVLNANIELPNEILKQLHYQVVKSLNENIEHRDSKDGMDIALIRIDLSDKKVLYAGAGRPLYVIKNNVLTQYKADKYSIGGIYDAYQITYQLNEISIDEATQLYMFSDGVPDQFGGPKGKKFMTKQLQDILRSTSTLPIEVQFNKFQTTFESWIGDTEQTDDVSLFSVSLS